MSGPYRIIKPQRILGEAAGAKKAQLATQDYLDRMIRLIPAEVVAGYTAVRNIFLPPEDATPDPFAADMLAWWLPLTGLLLTALLRIIGTRRSGVSFLKSVQWLTVLLAVLAYVIWILNLGREPVLGMDLDPRLPAALLVLVTILAPLFQQGDPE